MVDNPHHLLDQHGCWPMALGEVDAEVVHDDDGPDDVDCPSPLHADGGLDGVEGPCSLVDEASLGNGALGVVDVLDHLHLACGF